MKKLMHYLMTIISMMIAIAMLAGIFLMAYPVFKFVIGHGYTEFMQDTAPKHETTYFTCNVQDMINDMENKYHVVDAIRAGNMYKVIGKGDVGATPLKEGLKVISGGLVYYIDQVEVSSVCKDGNKIKGVFPDLYKPHFVMTEIEFERAFPEAKYGSGDINEAVEKYIEELNQK